MISSCSLKNKPIPYWNFHEFVWFQWSSKQDYVFLVSFRLINLSRASTQKKQTKDRNNPLPDSKILPTYPLKIPQTSPNPHKERKSFINCWWNIWGIFQGALWVRSETDRPMFEPVKPPKTRPELQSKWRSFRFYWTSFRVLPNLQGSFGAQKTQNGQIFVAVKNKRGFVKFPHPTNYSNSIVSSQQNHSLNKNKSWWAIKNISICGLRSLRFPNAFDPQTCKGLSWVKISQRGITWRRWRDLRIKRSEDGQFWCMRNARLFVC